jgi:ubiquinone/menaquinone biosynthesis C-methylase UbiE
MKKPMAIALQSRRPSGLLGQIVGRVMARETGAANRAALDALALEPDDRLLEIGCGHGWTLTAAAQAVTRGRLVGIDPSDVMLQIARRRNAADLRAGRMELIRATSDLLPLPDGAFDKALAVHTVYFWPHPERDLAEIRRVMAPGGRFVLGFRPAEDPAFARTFPAEVYHIRPAAEVERAARQAGFARLRTETMTTPQGLLSLIIADVDQGATT